MKKNDFQYSERRRAFGERSPDKRKGLHTPASAEMSGLPLQDDLCMASIEAMPLEKVWKRKSARRKEPFLKRFFLLASDFCIINKEKGTRNWNNVSSSGCSARYFLCS